MNISFLGLGRMGSELATHLASTTHDVTVWNRSPAATTRFIGSARIAPSVLDAVSGADVVVTALFGPDAVRDLIIHPNLAFAPGTLWIDTTTNGPEDAAAFANWASDRSIDYVHSPVIGSLIPARAGKLGVLLGGDARAVEKAFAVTSIWADPERVLVYDRAEKAATAKLVANLSLTIAMEGLVEALHLGLSGNLTRDETLAVTGLGKTPLAAITALKAEMILSNSYDQTQFSTDLLAKDIELMLSIRSAPLPALGAVQESLHRAQAAGLGDQDFSVIAQGIDFARRR